MCTLILAHRLWPECPLLVAANRDENLDRPSAPPRRWDNRPVPLLAPEDLKAGGSWLGLNQAGLFAGLTNRFGLTPPEPDRRSRGDLVLEALGETTAAGAFERLRVLPPREFNRFHLFLADREAAFHLWSDGEALTAYPLATGWHVLTERSHGAATTEREPRIQEWLAAQGPDRAPTEAALGALLSTHDEDGFEGLCVHVEAWRYGTRSSTLLRLGPEPDAVRWLHSEGPPCKASYQDLSAEAAALLRH